MSETIIRNLALCAIALVSLFESAELCFCILPCMIHAHTRTEGHLRGIYKSAMRGSRDESRHNAHPYGVDQTRILVRGAQ
jgi:hypothetical protein